MMRLQVRKSHLHFLAVVTRFVEGRGVIKSTSMIASIFVDVARHLAIRGFWTALRFERTGPAIISACPIAQGVIRQNTARRSQQLASRTNINIAYFVEFEVTA